MKKGFTLAEVLITLSILGVVAAITIPSVVHNYKIGVLKSQLKSAYSDLEQVSRMFTVMHNGATISKYKKSYEDGVNSGLGIVFDEIIDKQYIKIKSTKAQNSEDYPINTLKIGDIYKTLTNEPVGYKLIFNRYGAGYLKDNKGRDWFGRLINTDEALITIDINGYEKGPNRWGIDLFTFAVNPDNGEVGFHPDCSQCRDCNINGVGPTASASGDMKQYNGLNCAEYAYRDIHPKDSNKTYWKDFLGSF